jgi:hypothetical protein
MNILVGYDIGCPDIGVYTPAQLISGDPTSVYDPDHTGPDVGVYPISGYGGLPDFGYKPRYRVYSDIGYFQKNMPDIGYNIGIYEYRVL